MDYKYYCKDNCELWDVSSRKCKHPFSNVLDVYGKRCGSYKEKNEEDKVMEEQTRTIKQTLKRRECDMCIGKPATHQLTFLLPNARSNPASSAYGRDDCSWCSDEKLFACDECEKDKWNIAEKIGMKWCSDFSYKNFKHLFEYWEEYNEPKK